MCKEINIKELSSKDYQERQQSIALFLLNNSEIKEVFWQNLVKYNIEFLTSIIKISSQMSWKSIYRLLIEIDRQLGHNMLYFNNDSKLEDRIKDSADFCYFINSLLKYIFRNKNIYYLQYFFRQLTINDQSPNSFWYQIICLAKKKGKISDKNFIKLYELIKPYLANLRKTGNANGEEFEVIRELYTLNQKVLAEGRRNVELSVYKSNYISLIEDLIIVTDAYKKLNYVAIIEYIFYQLGKNGANKSIESFNSLLIDICNNNEIWKEKYLDDIVKRTFSQVNAPWDENELFPFLASAKLCLNDDHFNKINKFLSRNLHNELVNAKFREKGYGAWMDTKSYLGLYCLAYYQNKLFLEHLTNSLLELSTRQNHDIILSEYDYNSIYSLIAIYFKVEDNKGIINWFKRDTGILWERLVLKLLSKEYNDISYQVELDEYTVADIAINRYQDRNYFEKIVECKKSSYFIPDRLIDDDGLFDFRKHSVIVSKYIGFTDEFTFLILDDDDFIKFKCPNNIKIIYARDWLSDCSFSNQEKHEIELLMKYSIYLNEVWHDKKLPIWDYEIVKKQVKASPNVEGDDILDCLELLKGCVQFNKRSIINKKYHILSFDEFKQEGVF